MIARLARTLALLASLVVSAQLFAQSRMLVVYLPDAPVDAKRLAESAGELAQTVSARSGVRLELKLFRKADDCAAFLTANRASVAVVMAPPEFLADAAPDLVPLLQLTRGGRNSYRRVVVVKSSDAAKSLADLRGRNVAVVLPPGARGSDWLSRVVLHGELAGARFVNAADDQTAVANVVFGGADAAIVSEENPIAVQHLLGRDLRVLFTSGPTPRAVVALRAGAFSDAERESVETAFSGASGAVSTLQASGFTRVRGETLASLIAAPSEAPKPIEEKKTLEIAAVPAEALEMPPPSTSGLSTSALLVIEVPDIPLPPP